MALSLEESLGQGIHSFLDQIALGVELVPGLERVTLVGVESDGMVHLLHSLFSVQVELYLTSRWLFACQGELPAKGLPLVVKILHEAFACGTPFALFREWNT